MTDDADAAIDAAKIMQALDLDDVTTMVDINCAAPDLAVALNQRYGCKIDLVSLDRNGRFVDFPQNIVNDYLACLREGGVEKSAVRIVEKRRVLGQYDVIAAIDSFGSRYKIKHIKRILDRTLHAQSRLVINIRKGTGSYPFLGDYGGCNTLVKPDGDRPGLVIMSVEPKAEPVGDWSAIAHELAGGDLGIGHEARHLVAHCGQHALNRPVFLGIIVHPKPIGQALITVHMVHPATIAFHQKALGRTCQRRTKTTALAGEKVPQFDRHRFVHRPA